MLICLQFTICLHVFWISFLNVHRLAPPSGSGVLPCVEHIDLLFSFQCVPVQVFLAGTSFRYLVLNWVVIPRSGRTPTRLKPVSRNSSPFSKKNQKKNHWKHISQPLTVYLVWSTYAQSLHTSWNHGDINCKQLVCVLFISTRLPLWHLWCKSSESDKISEESNVVPGIKAVSICWRRTWFYHVHFPFCTDLIIKATQPNNVRTLAMMFEQVHLAKMAKINQRNGTQQTNLGQWIPVGVHLAKCTQVVIVYVSFSLRLQLPAPFRCSSLKHNKEFCPSFVICQQLLM